MWTRKQRKAAEGQRATSIAATPREFAQVVERTEPCAEGLPSSGTANGARIENTRLRVVTTMNNSGSVSSLEVPPERVEEFAAGARQIIDARLQTHAGECPDFWKIVAGLYTPAPEENSPHDDH